MKIECKRGFSTPISTYLSHYSQLSVFVLQYCKLECIWKLRLKEVSLLLFQKGHTKFNLKEVSLLLFEREYSQLSVAVLPSARPSHHAYENGAWKRFLNESAVLRTRYNQLKIMLFWAFCRAHDIRSQNTCLDIINLITIQETVGVRGFVCNIVWSLCTLKCGWWW